MMMGQNLHRITLEDVSKAKLRDMFFARHKKQLIEAGAPETIMDKYVKGGALYRDLEEAYLAGAAAILELHGQ